MYKAKELYVASQAAYTDEELADFIRNKIEPKMLKQAGKGEYRLRYRFRPFFPEGKVDAIRDKLREQGFDVAKYDNGSLYISWESVKYWDK